MTRLSLLKPRIAITMGDPTGVGPEVLAKAIDDPTLRDQADLLLIGSLPVLGDALERYAPSLRPTIVTSDSGEGHRVALLDTGGETPPPDAPPGPTSAGGQAALSAIDAAIAAARDRRVDAIVTGPISKEAIALAGCPHPGHTELLAHATHTRRPVMMLVGGGLRVALVTTHIALKKLALRLDEEAITATIRTTAEALASDFGLATPRLAVCGLNPHAGENGLYGREEKELIRPAVERARKRGISVEGPVASDTLFYQAVNGRYDAVVALYHDQGLIPVKLLAFHSGVNVTLGLPIVRTSPDHGTAFDIAGQGEANPGSMQAAIRLAIEIAGRR